MTTNQTSKRTVSPAQKRQTRYGKALEVNNPFKEVFIAERKKVSDCTAERKKLIAEVKVVRTNRDALRNVPGTKRQWAELTTEMHALQGRIDELNKTLGIPVKTFPAVEKKPHNTQPTGRSRQQTAPQHVPYEGSRGQTKELLVVDTPACGDFRTPTKPQPAATQKLSK